MQEKIEIIRQAAIKANSEIVELKFGCIVKLNTESKIGGLYYEKFRTAFWKIDNEQWRFVGEKGWIDFIEWNAHPDLFEIIGRPIRLADVLLAIGKDGRVEYRMATMTQLHIAIGYGHCLWNLLKDDLTLQSDETINFIYNLIK